MAFAVGNPTPEEPCKTVRGQKRHKGASTQTDIVESLQEQQPKIYLQNNGLNIGKRSWGH